MLCITERNYIFIIIKGTIPGGWIYWTNDLFFELHTLPSIQSGITKATPPLLGSCACFIAVGDRCCIAPMIAPCTAVANWYQCACAEQRARWLTDGPSNQSCLKLIWLVGQFLAPTPYTDDQITSLICQITNVINYCLILNRYTQIFIFLPQNEPPGMVPLSHLFIYIYFSHILLLVGN